jgi:hypothetical protein
VKPLGSRKFRRTIEGHQDCSTCHPELKSGRALEERVTRREVVTQFVPTGDGERELMFESDELYIHESPGGTVHVGPNPAEHCPDSHDENPIEPWLTSWDDLG